MERERGFVVKKLLLFVCVLTLVFALPACSWMGQSLDDMADSAGGEPEVDPEAAEVYKHNAYIELYNDIQSDIERVVFDYIEAFGSDDTVHIDDDFDGYSLYATNIADSLAEAMEYVDKEPLDTASDDALRALEPVLSRYAAALTEAKKYYGDKNYVDDDLGRAQAFHDVIVGEYTLVWEKADAFLWALDALLEGQSEEQLAAYRENGQMIHYYSLLSLISAQDINLYLTDCGIGAENIHDINMVEFRPLYNAFTDAYVEYTALAENKDAIDAEGFFSLFSYSSELADLKASLSELIDMVQNGRRFSDIDVQVAHITEGTPEHIRESTQKLLDAYNSGIV
jgi:hypothetical protein